jgi:hypothetical protein
MVYPRVVAPVNKSRSSAAVSWLLFWLLFPLLALTQQQPDCAITVEHPDSLPVSPGEPSLIMPLFHNPPVAILNDRPFRMDLFVNLVIEDVESVSLFMRVDTAKNYKEIPLEGEYSRYRYIIPKEELQGDALTYYFLVTLKDYSLYAYPMDAEEQPEPFVIDLVPPTKEFFQKELYD